MTADITTAAPLLIVAPHMDDEVLGCGLLLARHPDKQRVHVLFATDGSRSPFRDGDAPAGQAALAAVREREARDALQVLGVPPGNIEFLRLPDGALAAHEATLAARLVEHCRRLSPLCVFVPFRYDRHPDHLAVGRAVRSARTRGELGATVVEYFVYSQWRLLAAGDVRAYLAPDAVVRVPPDGAAALKRRALDCYRSQTTRYFDWQRRPILTSALLDRVCADGEVFVPFDPARPGTEVFTRARRWIPVAHAVEPKLKRVKDRLTGWIADER